MPIRGNTSTKCYAYTHQFYHPAIHTHYIEPKYPIRAAYDQGEVIPVELHDGSTIVLRKANHDYDPTDRVQSYNYLKTYRRKGEVVT